MEYDHTNSGVLYRNDRKERDSHPDFTGFLNVGGVEYWVSAWVKEGRAGSKFAGRKFFSLAVKPKELRPAPVANSTTRAPATPSAVEEMDDDIPF